MLAVFAAVLVLGAIYTASRKPVYESSARLPWPPTSPRARLEELALLNDLIAISRGRSWNLRLRRLRAPMCSARREAVGNAGLAKRFWLG